MSFVSKLEARVKQADSLLCVGLDPHFKELFPNQHVDQVSEEERCDAAYSFCKTIIDLTAPHAACYKPNVAFFEALGTTGGMTTLKRVMGQIPSDIPILLDVKRGDIGSTATAYADACFHDLGADAVTLSPLMGWDSVSPFVTGTYADKGAFVLCKTSNPGSNEILALNLSSGQTVYERIAQLANSWSSESSATLGLVVGATDPEALKRARQAAGPNVWILAPGVGAQGGNLQAALEAGMNENGTNILIPVSRGISQASNPASAAQELKDQINQARTDVTKETTSTIQPYQEEFLRFALQEGVLKFGSFVLKSGRTSPYFFNAGLFASGAALYKLGKAYAAAIVASSELMDGKTAKFDIVFGPAYKGISLGAMVCGALYSDYGIDVGFAYNRKEAKDHGEGGVLVGASMEEKRVLIVDDVITAGTAIRESYTLLKAIKGAKAIGVVIALDRAEKRSLDDPVSAVQAVARDLDIPVVSIVSLSQLQYFLEQSPDYEKSVLTSVAEYRAQYGV